MKRYHTKTFRLTEALIKELKKKSQKEQKPESEIVREALQSFLKDNQTT